MIRFDGQVAVVTARGRRLGEEYVSLLAELLADTLSCGRMKEEIWEFERTESTVQSARGPINWP